jgi:hypothetical protein
VNWSKKGLIYTPDTKLFWQKSHAALPTKMYLGNDVYRIYFTSRDDGNKTYVGYFDWKVGIPGEIIKSSENPILSPGKLGMFDDHGVQVTSVVKFENKVYLYYLGWNIGDPKPLFYTSIGLAVSDDGGNTFQKYSEAPIMERSKYDPWMVSGGTVIKENDLWRMWYISGLSFEFIDGVAHSKYDIKYAISSNGIDWDRTGQSVLPLQENESNISRMSIIKCKDKYISWFPVKKDNKGYRIGYAESVDGVDWNRLDHLAGIDVTKGSWDSDALDKVEVLEHKGEMYMLYNGNNFGKDGIGLAVYE